MNQIPFNPPSKTLHISNVASAVLNENEERTRDLRELIGKYAKVVNLKYNIFHEFIRF